MSDATRRKISARSAVCSTIVLSVALVSITSLFAANAALAAHPIYRATLNGPALDGYDTVAYFTLNRAVRGSAEYQHDWRDTTWYFSSAEHLALFKKDPEKYAPQFGGYCAYAVSRDRLYKGHPEVFTIEDGRLFFNNNPGVMQIWEKNPSHFIDTAERLFEELIGEQPGPAAP